VLQKILPNGLFIKKVLGLLKKAAINITPEKQINSRDRALKNLPIVYHAYVRWPIQDINNFFSG